MDPYMAADAQGHEQIRLVAPVAMMDHQGRLLATTTAAEAVACQNPLPQSTEKAQRMTAPVVTRAAALPAIGVREAARRESGRGSPHCSTMSRSSGYETATTR